MVDMLDIFGFESGSRLETQVAPHHRRQHHPDHPNAHLPPSMFNVVADTARTSVVEATRQPWAPRHPTGASRRLAVLECTAQSAGATGGIAKAATLAGVPQSGGIQRVYETWRWRDHEINFRVEGERVALSMDLF